MSLVLEKPSVLQPLAAPRRPGSIGVLAAEISAACDSPGDMGARIRKALERAVAYPDLLAPEHRATSTQCYARHVLYSDPLGRFTVLAIVWDAGQFSLPHAHETWCSYAVQDGSLRETLYSFEPASGKAKPLGSKVRDPGYSCFAGAGLDQIHRLGNPGTSPAISIHAYGVSRERISTHVNRVLEADER
jgi:predicted metal-dependent enzyme (double-stranded beta helix superfamily)